MGTILAIIIILIIGAILGAVFIIDGCFTIFENLISFIEYHWISVIIFVILAFIAARIIMAFQTRR